MRVFNTGLVATLLLLGTSKEAWGVIVSGELRQWHKITRTLTGPNTSETAGVNPFLGQGDQRAECQFVVSDAGGSRTRRHQGFSLPGMPISVPRHFSTPDRI